jgi:radical SAM superfamily enzyme YgiQ (UPF0313 family)
MPLTAQHPSKLLHAERGTIRKQFGIGCSVALVYPNTYAIGMSNLAVHFIYEQLNRRSDCVCERIFWDLDPFVSIESHRPLSDFDLIAFSISFELDYLHILEMLERCHIPLFARERNGAYPIIVAGGIGVTMNPYPIAPFVDAVVRGDGEEVLDRLIDAFQSSGGKKSQFLAVSATIPGVAIAHELTGLPGPNASSASNLNIVTPLPSPPCRTVIFTEHTEFASMCLIEIARGCPHKCIFCYVGNCRLPYRVHEFKHIRTTIEQHRHYTDRFGLVSSSVGRHPDIEALCDYALTTGVRLSFSSLHVSDIGPTILRALSRSEQRTLTIAPESGDETLRHLLGKPIADEQIIALIRNTIEHGIPSVKLYFLIGLPDESLEQCLSIVSLVKRLHHHFIAASKRKATIGTMSINLGIFVPKPGTPLSKNGMMKLQALRERIRLLQRGLSTLSNVRLSMPSPYEAAAQTLLSLGGPTISDFLVAAWRHRGNWKTALRNKMPEDGGTWLDLSQRLKYS